MQRIISAKLAQKTFSNSLILIIKQGVCRKRHHAINALFLHQIPLINLLLIELIRLSLTQNLHQNVAHNLLLKYRHFFTQLIRKFQAF